MNINQEQLLRQIDDLLPHIKAAYAMTQRHHKAIERIETGGEPIRRLGFTEYAIGYALGYHYGLERGIQRRKSA